MSSVIDVFDGVLTIIGTDDNDHVNVLRHGWDRVKVLANFLGWRRHWRTFDLSEIDSIAVTMCDGRDHVNISSRLELPTIIDGGKGNDRLKGGSGPDHIMGGPGDDLLMGF